MESNINIHGMVSHITREIDNFDDDKALRYLVKYLSAYTSIGHIFYTCDSLKESEEDKIKKIKKILNDFYE